MADTECLLPKSSRVRLPGGARRRTSGAVAPFLAGVLLFAALDCLVFRSGLYESILESASSTGRFESILWNELHRTSSGRNQVVAIGDSRMALMPRIANELTPATGYTFASVAVAGTSPRCWYYMLRDVDPTARRYAAVVITLDDYDDVDGFENYADRIQDLHYVIARLRLSDVVEFAGSFHSRALRWQAFRGSLFKGLVYQRDFQDFLLHPLQRIALAKLVRAESAGWNYNFVGDNRSLKGLRVDWDAGKIEYPATLTKAERDLVRDVLLRPAAPQSGRMAAYRREWLGRILDRYRGTGTKVIFVRLPRAPVLRPHLPAPNPHSSIRQFASRPDVVLCGEHLFDSLERPEFFIDPAHLSFEGCTRFSRILAAEVRKIAGPRANAAGTR